MRRFVWDMNGKVKLVRADIRLCCAEKNHEKMCAELRDVLISKFNNVEEAKTVKAYGDAEDFCVIATAVINPANKTKFVKALKQLHSNSNPSTKVSAVKVELFQQV